MIVKYLGRTLFQVGLKRFSTMPEPSAKDLQFLREHMQESEQSLSALKSELTKLKSSALEVLLQSYHEENKALQSEINLVKKELISYQVANGVPQIPVPGNDTDIVASVSSSAEVPRNPEPTINNENASSENKSVKAAKPKKQPAPPAKNEPPVDVGRLDIRVGKILHAQVHPDADTLYIEQIDVGEEISRTVVSGLVRHVKLSELDERMVIVLCNMKPVKMRGIISEAMVLCASTPETVELLIPPPTAKAGDNITVPGYPRNPDLPFMNPKKKILDQVLEDLKVNDKKQASYKDVPWQVDGREGYVTVQALSGCMIR